MPSRATIRPIHIDINVAIEKPKVTGINKICGTVIIQNNANKTETTIIVKGRRDAAMIAPMYALPNPTRRRYVEKMDDHLVIIAASEVLPFQSSH
jgi:hypothetical protein